MRIITREELKEQMEQGDDFVLVDVLSEESYQNEHIAGAINIPVRSIVKQAHRMLPNKLQEIVCYCTNFSCATSQVACELLEDMGYTKERRYQGGLEDWKDAHLPMESGREMAGAESR